jgi:hypothetical protein
MPMLESFAYTPPTYSFSSTEAQRASDKDRFGPIHGVTMAFLRRFIQKRFVESLTFGVVKGVGE